MRTPSRPTTALLSLALAGTLGLSACSSDEESSSSSSSSASGSSSGAPAPDASPVAQIDSLTGVETSVALDQGFVDALGALMLTPGTVGTGTFENGALGFPITGGAVSYYEPGSVPTSYVQGSILHAGSGFSLTGGGKTVELSNFIVDPGESTLIGSVTVDGEVAAENTPLFFLDGSTLEPLKVDDAAGTAVLAGTKVKLQPSAAALLNKTFGTDKVSDFLLVGTATITLALPQS